MQARQAMRDLGAFLQYNSPTDLKLPATIGGFTVTVGTGFPPDNKINVALSCGTPVNGTAPGAVCTAGDLLDLNLPKYIWMGAHITLQPMVLKSFTGGNLSYTERLQ